MKAFLLSDAKSKIRGLVAGLKRRVLVFVSMLVAKPLMLTASHSKASVGLTPGEENSRRHIQGTETGLKPLNVTA